MKRIKLLLFIAVLFASNVYSQIQVGKAKGFIGYYSPGVQFFAPTGLNSHFPSGYPEMDFGMLTQGGSANFVIRGFIVGWQGGVYDGGPFVNDQYQLDLNGDFDNFQLGFIAIRKNKFVAYPIISLNSNHMRFYIHQPENNETFQDIVDNPLNSTQLYYQSTSLGASLNAHYMLRGNSSENTLGGLILGLQIGYQGPSFKNTWKYDSGDVINGPVLDVDGFYIRITIGSCNLGYK
jgi:hypothetical protein